MGVLSFIKNAGSKLFGLGVSDDEKATKIIAHLQSFELDTTNLTVAVADEVVTLGGSVDTIFQKNKGSRYCRQYRWNIVSKR
jgi:osmotically-inducible protein OsmY